MHKYGTAMNARYLLPFNKSYKVLNVSSKVEIRLKWVDYYKTRKSFAQTSRHFDIPEPTVRYWIKRYLNSHSIQSLEDKSKRPLRIRQSSVPEEVIDTILTVRKRFPYLGKTKIQTLLKSEGILVGQSRIQKTINHFNLKRKKKVKVRKRTNKKHIYSAPKELLTTPGGILCIDVKHLRLPGGIRAYQFTAIDRYTRIAYAKMYHNISSRSGVEFFKYIKSKLPFDILAVGSDNGSENLGELEKYLDKMHIPHFFSSPCSPKQNPFVERFIKTIIDEHYSYKGLEVTMDDCQIKLDEYLEFYNNIRPHRSLRNMTPASYYSMLKSVISSNQ